MLDQIVEKQRQLVRQIHRTTSSHENRVAAAVAASKKAPTAPRDGSKRIGLDVTKDVRELLESLAEHYDLSYRQTIYAALDLGLQTLQQGVKK